METSKLNIIKENLPKLIEMTECNELLVAHLIKSNILTSSEGQKLCCMENPIKKGYELFELVKKRTNGFEELVHALKETNQTGVLKLINPSQRVPDEISMYDNFKGLRENEQNTLETANFIKVYRGKFGTRPAVIKFYKTSDPNHMELALMDLRILSELDWHKNIIRCFIARITNINSVYNQKYLAVAFEERTPLDKVISVNNLTECNRHSIIKQLLIGVEFIHTRRILHLNLKPENIFVKEDNQNLFVNIGAFNLAKKVRSDQMKVEIYCAALVKNQPESLSTPEILHTIGLSNAQSRTQVYKVTAEVDFSVDIFCLGVLIYYVASNGEHPFGKPLMRKYNIPRHIINPANQTRIVGFTKECSHINFYKCFAATSLNRPKIQSLISVFDATQSLQEKSTMNNN